MLLSSVAAQFVAATSSAEAEFLSVSDTGARQPVASQSAIISIISRHEYQYRPNLTEFPSVEHVSLRWDDGVKVAAANLAINQDYCTTPRTVCAVTFKTSPNLSHVVYR